MSEAGYSAYTEKLDALRRVASNGADYWHARELQDLLGYASWEAFERVIERARMACEATDLNPSHHFVRIARMVRLGSGARRETSDWILSRGACYLIAMNGDPRKEEVAYAQTYFAIQTRRQEQFDALTDAQRRILLRERVRGANVALNDAAMEAGVQNFGAFTSAGYKGQYGGLTVDEIKARKGIGDNEKLLDCIGRAELAMNEFRITQAERVIRNRATSEQEAVDAHFRVGKEVRDTVIRINGTLPEDLPREVSIDVLEGSLSDTPLFDRQNDDGEA